VKIYLPLALPPPWLARELILRPEMMLVILDDDPGMHQAWNRRFKQLGIPRAPASILHFESSESITQWYRQSLGATGEALFLCDYELIGSKQTGLDLIDMFGISDKSVLVTSHVDDKALRERCARLGVRLLPKSLAPFIPISIV
jgi:hypothetical protein